MNSKVYRCDICQKDLFRRKDLISHHATEHKRDYITEDGHTIQKWICPRCKDASRLFAKKATLMLHLKERHWNKKLSTLVFHCPFCPYRSFPSYDILMQHKRRSHGQLLFENETDVSTSKKHIYILKWPTLYVPCSIYFFCFVFSPLQSFNASRQHSQIASRLFITFWNVPQMDLLWILMNWDNSSLFFKTWKTWFWNWFPRINISSWAWSSWENFLNL